MLDRLIRISLSNRLLVAVLSAALLIWGALSFIGRPVDIFPDLNRPYVTVLTAIPGYAPEEVETLVSLPIEAAVAGAPGVERIRSTSSDGLSIVRAEFGWQTDLYRDRQLIQERLQIAMKDLPPEATPEMAPISSITGEIMDLGLTSRNGQTSLLDLRTLADWSVRRRLLSVPGVSQVVVIGGDAKQFQVLAESDRLIRHAVGLTDLASALASASRNSSGGYLVQGNRELQVRNLGRVSDVAEIANLVVDGKGVRPVRVGDVARVQIGPQFPRGSAALSGRDGVILSVFKQPDADTLELTRRLDDEIGKLKHSLPNDVQLHADLFRQATFLQRGVDNVTDALRDGSLLVVLVLLLFLFNLRASVITLLSLPLSFASCGLIFTWFDLSLNTMTLGGLAIAVGELVDDAIVGVENTVRRLRAGKAEASPNWLECLVADATVEVRGPIFSGTMVVILVFLPLLALSGIEGRLFSPLALTYVVALLASMLVSLTATPVLAWFLFRGQARPGSGLDSRGSPLLTVLQSATGRWIAAATRHNRWMQVGAAILLLAAAVGAFNLGSSFLPPFDEGTVLVLVRLPPGVSLQESSRLADEVAARLTDLEGVDHVARYTGRGEHDEHAPPVGISHVLLTMKPDRQVDREALLSEVRRRLAGMPGLGLSVGQPLAHRIDHLLSGVQAQVVIKVKGPDLSVLRATARQVASIAGRVAGVADLYMEPQVLVPQVHVALNLDRLADVGLTPGNMAEELQLAIGGRVVGQVLEGEKAFDLFVRLAPSERDSIGRLRQLPVHLPRGGWARLGDLARVTESAGPDQISRDDLVRRLAVSCNASGRSVGDLVADLKGALHELEESLPDGTYLSFEGQFASQDSATRTIGLLSLLSLLAMILLLYAQLRSFNLVFQVLICVPAAFIGGVGMLVLTHQDFSVAALVGFISLSGIASRNGILLMSHYLQLMRAEHGPATVDLLVRAGQERAAPVVMTALTTGVGLLPLFVWGSTAGREILYPVATVVIGGLLTSTLFEFLLRPALFWSYGRKAAERVCFGRREC